MAPESYENGITRRKCNYYTWGGLTWGGIVLTVQPFSSFCGQLHVTFG